jgi:general secretion pathway protein G
MLVVIAILATLAAFVVPNVLGRQTQAKFDAGVSQMKRISMQVENYALDNGKVPPSLEALFSRPGDAPGWNGPYVTEKQLKDTFGNAYQYKTPGEHGEFDLVFLGKDGQPGGEKYNRDVGNWE